MKVIQNPIEKILSQRISTSQNIRIAVPFMSFQEVSKILSSKNLKNSINKKILIKLDESSITSYDLKAIDHLLKNGFIVRFDNSIHLKLYIFDDNCFISSGNLTTGGLVNNFELTVQTTETESQVSVIFNKLWAKNKNNAVDEKYIKSNWHKYIYLKSKSKRLIQTPIHNTTSVTPEIEKLIEFILTPNQDYDSTETLSRVANRNRAVWLANLKTTGFDPPLFYVPQGHPNRKTTLFYEFVYGTEEKLAGTGLREKQFKDVFTSNQLQSLIYYLYPDYSQSGHSWNLSSANEMANFCSGLFEFKIRNYKESLPIRLAHYFHPNQFYPIFRLDHLQQMCSYLGYECLSKANGEKLFLMTKFLNEKLETISYSNYTKSKMLYQLMYTCMLKEAIDQGQNPTTYINTHKKLWIRERLNIGLKYIRQLA